MTTQKIPESVEKKIKAKVKKHYGESIGGTNLEIGARFGYRLGMEHANEIIQKMEEALAFYAEKSSWVSRTGRVGVSPIDLVDRDFGNQDFPFAGGKKARAVLAEWRKERGEK